MTDYVVLVDELDNEIGYEEKLKAHLEGKLHRAFSVFLFNEKKQLLLQRRALSKYHSAGLWTNSCCSHPKPKEELLHAANRRLKEELLIHSHIHLDVVGSFIYNVKFENELTENEFDYILIGFHSFIPEINAEEALDYKWLTLEEIKEELKNNSANYTFWFKEIISQFCNQIKLHIDESLSKRNI